MLGTLGVTDDGRFALRFVRRLHHPQAKVWRAITETEQLRGWFAHILDYDRLQFDLREGAQLAFVPKPEHAGLSVGRGEVTRVDPPRLLEYTWDSEILRWELEPDGDAACRLVFTNVFSDRGDAPALGAGWHAGLDQLAAMLDGHPADGSDWERLPAEYAHALG